MNKKQTLWIVFVVLLTFGVLMSGCTTQIPDITPTPQPLTGRVSRAEVEAAPGWEKLKAEDYTPDESLVDEIRENAGEVEVLLFLGTWCGDSKREVPHFFKLMDLAGISESQVEIIALDRSKIDDEGLAEKWEVMYVPTFIFIENDIEIGRIVESPTESLEADLADILSAN